MSSSMSISRNILLCTICQSLFNDARQLRCGHSFCYHCLISQFDRQANRIVCARCKRSHQFDCFRQFDTSLIADAFAMSLVGEYRRRSLLNSTPLLAFTLDDILQRSPKPFLIAKCAECTCRRELVVCPDCEQVICFECVSQHQLVINRTVQQSWTKCQETWKRMFQKSVQFDEKQIDLQCQMMKLKCHIEQRAETLLQLLETWREIYQTKLNQVFPTHFSAHDEFIRQWQAIEHRLEPCLLSSASQDDADAFLREIKLVKSEIRQRTKQMDLFLDHHRQPSYSTSEFDASILGTVELCSSDEFDESIIDQYSASPLLSLPDPVESPIDEDDEQSVTSDETVPIIAEGTKEEEEVEEEEETSISLEQIPKKKLLWSLNFKFVPQYIVLYRQSILFASDRWGFVSTWTYTNARTKPLPKKSFVLFPQFRVGSWSRVYVESFSVYKPYICVFVKGSDESLANFIAFFTHTGQLQVKVDYDHRYSLRQLICDESPKGNCIWAVDRGMHCIYKHDLPRTNKEIRSSLATHTTATRLSHRSCDVIRMAVNPHVLALLDSRTQIVTLFDKSTQQEIDLYSREFLDTGDHKLWRVELFPDNSLLLRFDDDERTGDRSQVIHHIVVHVKKSESNAHQYQAIAQIQATNVYGFAIGGDGEVIVGLRKSNCFEGLINCYV